MKCCDRNKKTDDEKNLPGILGCRERVPSTFDIAWQVISDYISIVGRQC